MFHLLRQILVLANSEPLPLMTHSPHQLVLASKHHLSEIIHAHPSIPVHVKVPNQPVRIPFIPDSDPVITEEVHEQNWGDGRGGMASQAVERGQRREIREGTERQTQVLEEELGTGKGQQQRGKETLGLRSEK